VRSIGRSQVRRQRTELEDWQSNREGLEARIAHRFARSEVRHRAQRYLAGLLAQVERKNGWQMAEHLGESGPQGVQRLLNAARWDADAVRDDLRDYAVEHLGDSAGVLVIDETGFVKKGTKSAGVQRQYSGTAGRIENCQVGVFLAYASIRGKAFLDRELYLPSSWAQDGPRREEAGIPADVQFATKPELARRMLVRSFRANVPASWVAGDEIYGNDTSLRQWLEAEDRAYVLGVSRNHRIWQDGSQVQADRLIAALPAEGWRTVSAGEGSQGPRLYDWVRVQLPYESEPDKVSRTGDKAHWLLARRSLSDESEIAYFRAYGPKDTPLSALVQVVGRRWTIEEGFERAKGMVGLDHYEVRKWSAWYRHVTLALLAHAYLEVTRSRAEETRGQSGVERGGWRRVAAVERARGLSVAQSTRRVSRSIPLSAQLVSLAAASSGRSEALSRHSARFAAIQLLGRNGGREPSPH
jgi:SRSO17 transposase